MRQPDPATVTSELLRAFLTSCTHTSPCPYPGIGMVSQQGDADWLAEHYGLIAVKDLNIKGLSRGILAGSVHDAGWNSFFVKLSYKAASARGELVKVDPRGTSQTCVRGAAVPKTLAERWHECPVCGLSAPRDVVTAQVILERARIGRSRHNP